MVCQSLSLDSPETNYSDILQRLVRRYLFKLERQKEEGELILRFVPHFCVQVIYRYCIGNTQALYRYCMGVM